MKNLITTICLTLTILLGSVGVCASADFQKGVAAFMSGDYATALREFQPLAKQGDADAQFNLGTMYEYGRGVPKNYKTAVKWYRLAAEQGNVYAHNNLDQLETRIAEQKSPSNARLREIQRKQLERTETKYTELSNVRVCEGVYEARYGFIEEAKRRGLSCPKYPLNNSPTVTARKSPPPSKSAAENEVETLRKRIAALEKEKQSRPKQVAKKPPPKKSPPPSSGSTGSGFFVSKLGHIVTNEHVVRQCGSVTVGDNANKQVAASVLETDKRNDLALLRISSTQMASVETKSLISKLGLKLVPLASEGLFKSDDVELGEDVLVAGYPYGDMFSNSIKVTKGIISSNIGMGDDRGQFQMDAAVQPGNSGGPIYDENGNIVGVVVSQLDPLKVAKAIGSLPQNVNFGIKASTVRQFLTSAGLPTKWSNRTERKSTKELAQIAKNQTVMVVCNP